VERRLNDGRTFEIVKIFYEPDELQERLATTGWKGYVRGTDNFFLYGSLSR
jgi:demethylmenaquinone methyltransferase/2-methoxy-6-polyprenyl-1,4-benzoquinol methylase